MFGRKVDEAEYEQAVSTAIRLLLLAENGEKLLAHMQQWTDSSHVADPETRHEMRHVLSVNRKILYHFQGKSWKELSDEYKDNYTSFMKPYW